MLNAAIAQHANNIETAGIAPFRDSVASNLPGTRWWLQGNPQTYLSELNHAGVAMYVAANWDEAGSKYGAFFTFNNVEQNTKLVIGPGAHCAWFTVESQTGFDISVEELRFFDHWLKGIPNHVMEEPKVYYYTYNAPAGAEWRASATWPLSNQQLTPYYLGAGSLDAQPTSAAAAHDEAAVDYTVNATNLAEKGLTYVTPPLSEDVEITGHPVIDLWVSSSATDGDFIATLQDVAPDGKATSYNIHGRLRASHRKEQRAPYDNLGLPWHSYAEADVVPLSPGEPAQLRFDLLPISMVVKAGHRLRLVLTFAEAVTPKLEPAPRVRIYRDAAHPSVLTLPIIPR
jgi:predicted acyl esterase